MSAASNNNLFPKVNNFIKKSCSSSQRKLFFFVVQERSHSLVHQPFSETYLDLNESSCYPLLPSFLRSILVLFSYWSHLLACLFLSDFWLLFIYWFHISPTYGTHHTHFSTPPVASLSLAKGTNGEFLIIIYPLLCCYCLTLKSKYSSLHPIL